VKIWASAAFLLFLQSPAFQQVRNGRIEGYVVRAGTNEPLESARVTIRRNSDAGQIPSPPQSELAPMGTAQTIATDSQGHFVVNGLAPGSYELSAVKNGFARQVYGERAPGRPGTVVTVSAEQVLKDVVFRLVAAGAISGHVTDTRGGPLTGILVQLLRSTYDAKGRRRLQPVSSARTNERGEYRMYLITPGRFFVSAAPVVTSDPSMMAVNTDPSMMAVNQVVDEPGLVLTYYPGSSDPSGGSSIEVEPGSETGPIDFRLMPQPLFRIRGRVLDTRPGHLPEPVQLEIESRNPGSPGGPRPGSYTSENGTFEIRNVAPGAYWIKAQLFNANDFKQTIGDLLRNMAQVSVDVSNADVENVVVTFSPGFSLQGRVEIDSSGNGASRETSPLMVYLEPQESTPVPTLPQTVKADGTFTIDNVFAGDYRVQTEGGPSNSYIKSVHLGRTDVSNGLTLSGPVSESLELILGTTSGEIDGTVLDSDRHPVSGAQVVLIPNRERGRSDLYRKAITDQNGRFTIRTIVPGEYKVFAWEDLEPYAYNDADFLRKYEELGTPVAVSESAKSTIQTRIIPAG
jgi:protocatechuate 3,4-dioxygenase beta subunit